MSAENFIINSDYSAFKNNAVFTGTAAITGSLVTGYNEKTWTVSIPDGLDMTSVTFNGPTDASDPRPAAAWFPVGGAVWVRGDNAGAGYVNYPTRWVMTAAVSGNSLILKAASVSSLADTLTLTSTNVSYRIVDFSVF